MQKFARIAE